MLKRLMSTAGLLALAMAATAGAANAQATNDVDAVVVTVDAAGLLERAPSNTVFGLNKPLIETPRSATFISDVTLERYGLRSVDDLVAISPSSYTSSFYGVPGSLNVRGTLAENYFRGFKRLENRGTYSTPIGAAARVEVVRGPPTPIFGAGKVGGLLNFTPKSGQMDGKYISEASGEITATTGSYNKKIVTAQGGLPIPLGADKSGGVYGYMEIEDSHSFYHGIYPRRQTFQLSSDFDLGGGWSTSLGGMYYHSKGDVQTAGWNRLTQTLIDNQIYITGRDTDLKDANGSGKIEPSEVGFYPFATALYLFGGTDAKHQLDTGVGTTKLSPRTVYIARSDFSRTDTGTLYFDLAKELTASSGVKLQLFWDKIDNQRFVSYGFPASYQSQVGEIRLTYNFDLEAMDGGIIAKSFVGASSRTVHAHSRESFNSGLIALDRRDISVGAQPNDIIDSPYSADPPGSVGLGWENNVYTDTFQNGVFAMTDVAIGKLDLLLGGRYDDYSASSDELGGAIAFAPAHGKAGKGMGSYTASVTYKLPYGFMPYYTYSKSAALEVGQASQIPTSLLQNSDGGYLSDSYLSEGGVKFSMFNNTLVGSLDAYRQIRTRLTQGIGTVAIVGTRSTGVEAEIRWIANKNLSFTLAGNSQHTSVKGPDKSFVYLPASQFGVSGVNGFGGSYVSFDFSSIRGTGDYDYSIIPHSVVSLYGNYTTDQKSWGRAGFTVGFTHVTKTKTLLKNPIVYPSYWVGNLSAFYEYGPYSVVLNVDNVGDTLYFTPDADSYANLGALPSVGREWRLTLKRSF